jgi:kynurenine formamidase
LRDEEATTGLAAVQQRQFEEALMSKRLIAGSIALGFAIAVPSGVRLSGQAGAPPQFTAHASTQERGRLVTLDMLKRWEQELSNWGRWGKEDQRGLLNLITPAKTKQATTLVREGLTVTLQINPFKKTGSDTGGFGENVHRMARINPVTGVPQGALDIIQLSIHDGLSSHLDALCHYQGPIGRRPGEPAVSYNGFPFTLTAAGCRESAADRMGPGYITRGILVDMPLLKGVRWLEPTTPIYVEDLEAWEKYAGITIGAGDALIIRGGRWAKRDAEGPWAYGQGGAGIHASVLPWLRARDVSILASDAVNDVQPSGVEGINRPVHQLTQVNMGLPIVDNAWTEDAAREAQRLRRWEFMFTLHIYQVQGGTASPFNALATF